MHINVVLCFATSFLVVLPISSSTTIVLPSTNVSAVAPPPTTSVSPSATTVAPSPTTSPLSSTISASTTSVAPSSGSTNTTSTTPPLVSPNTTSVAPSSGSTNTTSPTSPAGSTSTTLVTTTPTTTTTSVNTTAVVPSQTNTSTVVSATASASAKPTLKPTTTPTPRNKFVRVKVTFDLQFKEDYRNKSSKAYKKLEKNFTVVLTLTFSKMKGFIRVDILSFRQGSVVCEFDAIFEGKVSPKPEEVKKTLQEASNSGNLGGYVVKKIEIDEPTTTTKKPSDEIWDKVIMDYLGGTLISFIVMVAAVGLCLILLIALICTCCRYRKLKKKTMFPKDLIINNDSAWINSHDNLLMWERNLRATEVTQPSNAPNRPPNEKRP